LTLSPDLGYNRNAGAGVRRAGTLREELFIPFPTHAQLTDEPTLLETQRRRRDLREAETRPGPRRARRRRQTTPWLQRNALSIAAVSVLLAFLGMGFGLVQAITRSASPSVVVARPLEDGSATPGAVLLSAAAIGPSVQVDATNASNIEVASAARPIKTNVTVLQPNYTIGPGDTLVQLAQRFNTTVTRIQAFNNLSDPRTLRIGTKLIIPPPL